jgi:hypothetical protein
LDREKFRGYDFGQFDTFFFQRALLLMDATANVVDHRKIESFSNESIVYKGKEEHLGRSFATDLGLGISQKLVH